MGKILYAIKPIGVTKGFGRVYNKQLYIGKYEVINGTDIKLVEVQDFNKNIIKRHSFPASLKYGSYNGIQTEDVGSENIYSGMPNTNSVILFVTLVEAKLQKLIDIKYIKIYFEKELRKLQERAENNLPKNIEEIFEEYSGKYPEYLI